MDSRSELKQLIENGELIKALEYTTTDNRYYKIVLKRESSDKLEQFMQSDDINYEVHTSGG